MTKYGYKTGYSYGTVTATNVSISPATGMTITGMTRVSITSGDGSEGGDSGGPYLVGDALLSCRVGLVRLEHMIAQVGPILVHRLIEVTVRYVTRPCTKRTLNTGMIYMGNAFAVEEQIQL